MQKSSNTLKHQSSITCQQRALQNGHHGAIIWFTGLSGSGKSTLAHAVEKALFERGCRVYVLDGDNVRHGLCADLGFSEANRQENIRRVGEMAKLFMDAGMIVITALISPYRADRDKVRAIINANSFAEIYCSTPIEVCENRDVKGLYQKARSGEIRQFTGISSPYEAPKKPELAINAASVSIESSVTQVLHVIENLGVFKKTA
jgi:adenylylsulfate kinase